MGSTWWSSGPVVVMVPSGGKANDGGGGGGGGVEARCNRCYERRRSFSLHVLSFRMVRTSYVVSGTHTGFFCDTASSILLGPEIISGDYRRTWDAV